MKIRKATLDDSSLVSLLLYRMYTEVAGERASQNLEDYKELYKYHLSNDQVFLYEDKAVFVMRDVSISVIDMQMWDGVSVYILPEYRKTKILYELYKYMFANFSGSIVGFVEPNSKHYKVVSKRNRLVGYVYELNRS